MRLWLHVIVLLGLWAIVTVMRASLTTTYSVWWYLGIIGAAAPMAMIGYVFGKHDYLAEQRRRRNHGRIEHQ